MHGARVLGGGGWWVVGECKLFGCARECVGGCVGVRVSGCGALLSESTCDSECAWVSAACARVRVQKGEQSARARKGERECVFPSHFCSERRREEERKKTSAFLYVACTSTFLSARTRSLNGGGGS